MAADYSWSLSATTYLALYAQVLKRAKNVVDIQRKVS